MTVDLYAILFKISWVEELSAERKWQTYWSSDRLMRDERRGKQYECKEGCRAHYLIVWDENVSIIFLLMYEYRKVRREGERVGERRKMGVRRNRVVSVEMLYSVGNVGGETNVQNIMCY